MAPARTRRRSSGGNAAAAAAAAASTPLSAGKAPLEAAGTPGSVVAVRAFSAGPASAAVPYPPASTSVTPAPFAPLRGGSGQETVIDDLPEELLLKVRGKKRGEKKERAKGCVFLSFSDERRENAARQRQLLFCSHPCRLSPALFSASTPALFPRVERRETHLCVWYKKRSKESGKRERRERQKERMNDGGLCSLRERRKNKKS